MSQHTLRRPKFVFGTFRLLLALLLLPIPALAQGPRPLGLQHIAPRRLALPLRGPGRCAPDEENRAERGAVIGAAVGIVLVLGMTATSRNTDGGVVKLYAITAGVIGGYIGYLVGRGQ